MREVLDYVQFKSDALVSKLRRDVEATALREGRPDLRRVRILIALLRRRPARLHLPGRSARRVRAAAVFPASDRDRHRPIRFCNQVARFVPVFRTGSGAQGACAMSDRCQRLIHRGYGTAGGSVPFFQDQVHAVRARRPGSMAAPARSRPAPSVPIAPLRARMGADDPAGGTTPEILVTVIAIAIVCRVDVAKPVYYRMQRLVQRTVSPKRPRLLRP